MFVALVMYMSLICVRVVLLWPFSCRAPPCGQDPYSLGLLLYILISGKYLQDEDFVADKDDEGSPTDDSGAEDSDASESGDEKEASDLILFVFVVLWYNLIIMASPLYCLNL